MKVVIVDDEPHARESIRLLLQAMPEVNIVAECDNGKDAIQAIEANRPELVFLDVQMPEMNGFEVVERFTGRLPYFVFITAYDAFAIQAFEINAVDYLLKPYEDERFYQAFEKAKDQLLRDAPLQADVLTSLISQYVQGQKEVLKNLSIKVGKKIIFVKDESIRWIEAADQYCTIHTVDKDYLVRESMKFYEERLDPMLFFRIHRSSIVNLTEIKELQPFKKGRYAVILTDGQILELGPNKLEELKKRMGRAG